MTAIDLTAAKPVVRRRVELDPRLVMALPSLAFMSLVFAFPLALLMAKSFQGPDGLTLAGYNRILGDAYYRGVIWDSLTLACRVTLITLLFGYPAAYALTRAKGGFQLIMFALVFLPLTVSIIVKTFGLTIMFRREGILNWLLLNTGLLDAPVRFVFTEMSLVIGMVNVFLPFLILPLYSVMRMLDARYLDAAATLGTSPLNTFRRVFLPLTMPGVIAGSSIVFALSVAAYVTPGLLIGERYMTMSMVMAKAFLNFRDYQLGSAMACIMLAIALVIVFLSSFLTRNLEARGR
ncbi:ABC transporter permease [Bradyrhizobium sp. LHD-71]|uniref:ABC transporter permease n=1 Tax=Bradyrhizobium sp. LHD-71 TaxID=3072141 RepID=UPI00280FAA5C|nr:ABC transporter permease [Bradyrhizobium sp. LHD-71]MDQ8727375.1 ABC transporter permease [Bradyrhizobium sp. LHD-71]